MDLNFWFSLGSTYTYLSVMRRKVVLTGNQITIRWRPFQLGMILKELDGLPFKEGSPKTRYMWRDIGRRAKGYGLNPKLPAHYPTSEINLANRIASVGLEDDWGEAFIDSFYRRWFETENALMDKADLRECIAVAGANPDAVIAKAEDKDTIDHLISETDEARRLGVFGSPTFSVGTEIFWGDDRFDDAVRFASRCAD